MADYRKLVKLPAAGDISALIEYRGRLYAAAGVTIYEIHLEGSPAAGSEAADDPEIERELTSDERFKRDRGL